MTKPLGSGIIATAIKKGKAEKEAINQVTEIMTTLNDRGLAVAKNLNANAAKGYGIIDKILEQRG